MKQGDHNIVVLHVAEAAGGVEKYLTMLLSKWNYTDVHHHIVASVDFENSAIKEYAESFRVIPSMCNSINLKRDLLSIAHLRRYIKQVQPDVVYAHSSKAGLYARLACVGLRVKVIYNPHGWAFNMSGSAFKRNLYQFIEMTLGVLTDKIVLISPAEYISCKKCHIVSEHKMRLISNGIDIDKTSENLEAASQLPLNIIPDNSFVIGMIGRPSRQKATDVFVEVAKELKKHIPNAFFIIVGDGPDRKELEEQINSSGLEKSFYITGWVDNTELYLSKFNIAVLLSRWEGFGLVLAEYMVARKPIVATNVDAIPFVVEDGKDGLLVPVDNKEKAFEAILKLYKDEKLRNSLITHASETVGKKFSIYRVCKEHYDLFCDVIK